MRIPYRAGLASVAGALLLASGIFMAVKAPARDTAQSQARQNVGTLANMPSEAEIKSALKEAHDNFKGVKKGKNADYIPVLAKVDPNLFGIALVTVDGDVYTEGDVKSEVSIQSIAKVFTLALVLEQKGPEAIVENTGVDATGMPFNSIVAVEMTGGKPEMNPLVNAGAIATTSMVKGKNREQIWNSIQEYYSAFAGRPLEVDQEVYKSESETNERNQAIAKLMHTYGHIEKDPEQATDIYTEQGSISVNARDLAVMAATLANGGVNPVTGKKVMSADNVPEVLSVMATAGLYDDTGKWLYKTGLPAKSGVGGGIIAVSPGRFGIAAISPPLDEAGNSVRAQLAIEYITDKLEANPYAVSPVPAKDKKPAEPQEDKKQEEKPESAEDRDEQSGKEEEKDGKEPEKEPQQNGNE